MLPMRQSAILHSDEVSLVADHGSASSEQPRRSCEVPVIWVRKRQGVNSVNIRWTAVISGFMTDFALTILLQMMIVLFGQSAVFTEPSLQNPIHVLLILLGASLTGVGGFVAGWFASEAFAMHGLLVGVVGILVAALANVGISVPPLLLFGQVLGCACGAFGGMLAGRLRRISPIE